MNSVTILDWSIFLGGLLGFIGTLRGWKVFMNENRMELIIGKFGVRRVRIAVSLMYLAFGIFGAFLVLSE